jgi:septal ring factor EnvC (AmiA/AmiB activator)
MDRPLGPEGQPLSPEEEAGLARSEARNSRRWAYAGLFFGLLATVGAAIALIVLVSQADEARSLASREHVRRLEQDVRQLREQDEAARRARSEADSAADRSRSVREQVDDLEARLSETNDHTNATQRQVSALDDELKDDLQQLRDDVQRLQREGSR